MTFSKHTALWMVSFSTVIILLLCLFWNDPVLKTKQYIVPPPRPYYLPKKSENLNTKLESSGSYKPTEEKEDIAKILDVVKSMKHKKPLLVTLINNAYLPFTYSWLCNTKDMNIHKQVLLITTDSESKDHLNTLWPDVKVVAISGMSSKGDQTYSHAGYVRLMIRRTQILLKMLQNNIEIFLFEVDCLWIKNPVPTLAKNIGFDILVNPVSNRPGIVAGGFIYMFPTRATKYLWNELNNKLTKLEQRIRNLPPGRGISEGENDQIYLSDLVKRRVDGLKCKTLPLTEFSDGKWYSFPNKTRTASDPYVVNNNWVNGNQNKISRAKAWGHWFIRKDNSCDTENVKEIVKL
ncbi:uncharacterized protein [Mytilus edulis]|uniref:uncharacterized protein n=1 Tax=Mytilus edulis TaxID=6550 RepID=UPI0039F12A2B